MRFVIYMFSLLCIFVLVGCNLTTVKYTDPNSGVVLDYTKMIIGKEETKGFEVGLGESPYLKMAERSSESDILIEIFRTGFSAGMLSAGRE